MLDIWWTKDMKWSLSEFLWYHSICSLMHPTFHWILCLICVTIFTQGDHWYRLSTEIYNIEHYNIWTENWIYAFK